MRAIGQRAKRRPEKVVDLRLRMKGCTAATRNLILPNMTNPGSDVKEFFSGRMKVL
jgi:hypothetical protein